ncbi:unnamed protein product [Fusarium graminearum]|nr:unnamed protein product [Fusarium graminearum]
MGETLWDKEVRIRWEDSWKPSDWEDRDKEVKCIVKRGKGYKKVCWKDTWEPLENMDDGKLKEKAIMLFEDKYGNW